MKNLPFLVALQSIDGLGPVRLKRVLDYFEDPKLAWEAPLKEFENLKIPKNVIQTFSEQRKTLDPLNYFETIQKSNIKILTIYDPDYPQSLKQIYDPPLILFYKGQILPSDKKAIGIVGTRKITSYGQIITQKLTSDLVNYGFCIISGLARGVDTIAHKSALTSNGRTLAILGGGLNSIFPPENYHLAQNIIDSGGALISEYPPDYPHLAGNFPSRNRIIAGLSLAVLVTEAAQDSGSLITAHQAIEQGKEVFAVPGPITSTVSDGTAKLIKEGANLTTSVEEILETLGMEQIQSAKIKNQNLNSLSENEKLVLNCLENEQKHIDEICRQLKKPTPEISSILIKMEMKGLIKNLGTGIYAQVI